MRDELVKAQQLLQEFSGHGAARVTVHVTGHSASRVVSPGCANERALTAAYHLFKSTSTGMPAVFSCDRTFNNSTTACDSCDGLAASIMYCAR